MKVISLIKYIGYLVALRFAIPFGIAMIMIFAGISAQLGKIVLESLGASGDVVVGGMVIFSILGLAGAAKLYAIFSAWRIERVLAKHDAGNS